MPNKSLTVNIAELQHRVQNHPLPAIRSLWGAISRIIELYNDKINDLQKQISDLTTNKKTPPEQSS
jgi:hypothetical protein